MDVSLNVEAALVASPGGPSGRTRHCGKHHRVDQEFSRSTDLDLERILWCLVTDSLLRGRRSEQ